ncbi:MAG: HAMP domain-containing histidine kinase [Lachnospiraceae bacterium]|nr:HAMP domain-containing histidine kinase [Lachnospiraceae bacterium]
MGDRSRLKGRIILRFIKIMILVSIAEYFVMTFINALIMPFIRSVFFTGMDIADLKVGGVIVIFLGILIALIIRLIEYVLPSQIHFLADAAYARIYSTIQEVLYRGKSQVGLSGMGLKEKIMLSVFAAGFFLIVILPFIIGALYFTRVIMKEFGAVEEAERNKEHERIRMRNLMLTDIAHDLRTPMTTVSGYAKALSDGIVPEDKKEEYLEAIRNKTARMDELIGLLFDYTKLENEDYKLDLRKADICEVVRECAAGAYTDIEDAGMEADINIPEEYYEIRADKAQLSRVITNLIINAVRHNDAGTKIGVFVKRDGTRIRVMVADTGKMIDKEISEHLFEPFYTGDASRSSKGGTGLGLSIASKVANLHGYKLKLRQRPDIARYNLPPEYTKAFIITI